MSFCGPLHGYSVLHGTQSSNKITRHGIPMPISRTFVGVQQKPHGMIRQLRPKYFWLNWMVLKSIRIMLKTFATGLLIRPQKLLRDWCSWASGALWDTLAMSPLYVFKPLMLVLTPKSTEILPSNRLIICWAAKKEAFLSDSEIIPRNNLIIEHREIHN